MSDDALSRVRVILVEPQDPVNIAGVVRAMRNMGAASLHLVRPCAYDPVRITGVAHGAGDLVSRIEHHDTLEAALADCVQVAAFTARRRAARRESATPRAIAPVLVAAAATAPVAMLFGREDAGLPNAALDRSSVVVTIPTTEHASLNLAQAVLIALYELRLAAPEGVRVVAPPRKAAPPATHAQFERLFTDVAATLHAIDFFKSRYPALILRTVRSLAFRAAPDARELELLRAMAIEVRRVLDRERDRASHP